MLLLMTMQLVKCIARAQLVNNCDVCSLAANERGSSLSIIRDRTHWIFVKDSGRVPNHVFPHDKRTKSRTPGGSWVYSGRRQLCGISRPEVALCPGHFVTYLIGPKQLSGKDLCKLQGHAGKSRLYSG